MKKIFCFVFTVINVLMINFSALAFQGQTSPYEAVFLVL